MPRAWTVRATSDPAKASAAGESSRCRIAGRAVEAPRRSTGSSVRASSRRCSGDGRRRRASTPREGRSGLRAPTNASSATLIDVVEVVGAGARRVAPGDEAVAREHEPARRRQRAVARQRAREREAGAHVVDVGDVAAEDLAHEILGVARVGQRLRREVVRVDDAAVGEASERAAASRRRAWARGRRACRRCMKAIISSSDISSRRLEERRGRRGAARRELRRAQSWKRSVPLPLTDKDLDLAAREVLSARRLIELFPPSRLRQRRIGADGVRQSDEHVEVVAVERGLRSGGPRRAIYHQHETCADVGGQRSRRG